MSPNTVLDMYDDGLGSYVDNIIPHDENASLRPRRLYVVAPELVRFSRTNDIRKLPVDLTDRSFREQVESVFAVSRNKLLIYDEKRLVFLTQPVDERGRLHIRTTEDIVSVLAKYVDDVVIRKHPRDMTQFPSDFIIDNTGIPWELACVLGTIRNDMMLIADCSTAQMMPALMGTARPSIMFLAGLYANRETNNTIQATIKAMIDVVSSAYDESNLCILKPNTLQEFDKMISPDTINW